MRNGILMTLFLAILLGLAGCKSEPASTDDQDMDDDPPAVIEKSDKRGIAYNLLDPADFDTLKSGVSWWYNWYFETDAPDGYYEDYQMEFLPMLWGGNGAGDFEAVKDFILSHPEIEYLLVLNEPNLVDQANQTPQTAAANWPDYEQVITDLEAEGHTIYLVGPQMNWGTMQDYADPVDWLDAFYEAYQNANGGRDPRIDYLAFHWYDYGLEAQLDRLQKYNKQIWITEMANWNAQVDSYIKQIEQMREMVALCEDRDDVFRYAWFIGRGTYPDDNFTFLFDPDPGDLSALGNLYISLPY